MQLRGVWLASSLTTTTVVVMVAGGGLAGNLLPLFVDYNAHICFGQYALCPEKTPVDALQNGLDIYRYLLTVMVPMWLLVCWLLRGGSPHLL